MNFILVSLVLSVSKLVASPLFLFLSVGVLKERRRRLLPMAAVAAAGKTDEAAVSIPVYPTSIDPVREY